MGMYITLEDSNVILKNKHLDEVSKRFTKLNDYDECKNGRGWDGDKQTAHFSWMPKDYYKLTPKQIFEKLGFDMQETKDGLTFYNYDNKMGQESLFIGLIEDLLESTDGEEKRMIFLTEYGDDFNVFEEYTKDEKQLFKEIINKVRNIKTK